MHQFICLGCTFEHHFHFSYFSAMTYSVGSEKFCLSELVLFSTHRVSILCEYCKEPFH